ncbi:LysM peptidoglycan-binding domain-containing protein [Streptomyces sp. TLI_171]|uniref:LysM peptidoglycan-binding domain-containing protein n=1 Tax=Streptomyces sp. TLI_171 TaxID=1938859 RepID=UPI000C18602E|nr:LysM peptidoglycan-binding domain-containing protein [Streptomyces sp. TLI_171]RKE02966.1 LysM domain-containing protein [Streptomyces sp. TLI_171]
MPPKTPRRIRTRSRLRDLPCALGGLVVLLGLLTALPVALLAATHRYAGPGLAAFSSASQIFTRQDNGAAFLLVLVIIGWIGWGSFTVSVLLEIPAQLRGRAAPRLRGFAWSQQVASTLVSAILLLVPTTGAALAAGTHPATAAAAHAPAAATASAVAGYTTAPGTAQAAGAQRPTYTVQSTSPAQSLWSIAQHQLGAGERWHEIADLNNGRTMADGLTFHSDRPIQPGWVLLMPDTAAAAGTNTAAPHERGATITVHPGDTLSALAQEHLGNADRFVELYDANRDRLEPGGERLTDPDHIKPGWTLVLPADSAAAPSDSNDADTPAPAQGDAADTTGSGGQAAAPTTAPGAPATTPSPAPTTVPAPAAPAPAPTAAAGAAATAGGTSTAATPPSQHPTAPAEQTESADSSDTVRNLAAGGALLAAGVLASIGGRRLLQQRRRGPNRRIPMPAGESAGLERQLRATTNPVGLALLDRSLRSMAARAAEQGRELPQLEAVRVTADTIELYLAAPATPIAPFTAADNTALWRCGSSTRNTALLSAEDAVRTPAPYPTLVSLGHTPDGDPVLVDLETMGLLSLDGSDDDVLAVMRAFTVELANSAIADDRLLLLAGVAEELAELYPAHSDFYDTLPEALVTLASRAAFQRQALQDGGHSSLRAARVGAAGSTDAWTPHVLISTAEPTSDEAQQMADLLCAEPRTSIGVIAGSRTDLPVESSWRIPADAGLEVEIDGLPFSVVLQRIEPEAYRRLVDVLATAERRDTLPAPAWTRPAGAAAADPAADDADQDAEPLLAGADAGIGSALAAQVTYAANSPALALGPATVPGTVTVPIALTKNTAAAPAVPGQSPSTAGAAGTSPEWQDLDLVAEEDEQEHRARAAATLSPAGADEADQDETVDLEDVDLEEDVFGLADDEDPDWGEDEEDLDTLVARYAQDADDEQDREQTEEQHDVRHDGELQGEEEEVVDGAAAQPVTVPIPAPAVVPACADARVSHRLHHSSSVLAALTADTVEPSVPYIRVLGRVEVLGLRSTKQEPRRRQLTEVAAWLVLNPGSSRLEFDEAMWGQDVRVDAQNRNTLMSRTRRWLGDKPDGSPYLPHITGDEYRLDPAVMCDWVQFQALYRDGHHGSGLEADIALAQALALVRGRPFAGTLATKYTWNEAWLQEMISAIEDAAHELAQRRLAERDYRAAAMAAARGLEAVPESELLYRDLFEVHAASGDRESLERAARRLHDLNEELGVDPEEETVELLETLLKGRRTATA